MMDERAWNNRSVLRPQVSVLRMVAAQTRVELLLTLRRGESVLVILVIPTLLLLFFGSVDVLPTGGARAIDFLLPGLLSLAVMSTAMVSLGIGTAFERHYRVLKRLGGSPLPRAGLLVAKIVAVLAVELIQVALLLGIAALVFGWRPAGNLGLAPVAVLLGTAAFGGLGLWMAGTLRAEATLAVANGLYLVLLLLGGIVVPLSALPGPLAIPAALLPSAALADALRASFDPAGPLPIGSLGLLAGWAIATPVAAALTFRWE
jgi:ABC-2 type transport system permease protein